jgi:hypothetical protein
MESSFSAIDLFEAEEQLVLTATHAVLLEPKAVSQIRAYAHT